MNIPLYELEIPTNQAQVCNFHCTYLLKTDTKRNKNVSSIIKLQKKISQFTFLHVQFAF